MTPANVLEQGQDPYKPGPWQLGGPGIEETPRTPAGSVQVNVNASGNNIIGDAANEPTLAVDPTNTQHMVIGWRQFDTTASNFRQAGYGYTTDGGAHWTAGVLNPGVARSDPVLTADNSGRIFYDSLQVNTFCQDVFTTTNGGQTWSSSVPANGGDKNWIVCDRTLGSGSGFLHSVWQSAAPCTSGQFTRSTNHGATWSSPSAVTGTPRFGIMDVGPDGTLYIAGVSAGSFGTFVVSKSTNANNGGVTPTFTSVSGNFLAGSQVFSAGPNPAGLLGQAYIAVNPNLASHVYLLCSVGANSTSPTTVRFSRSVDGGVTWGASVRVNDDPVNGTTWHWFGTMSVAPNGRIDVVWNDTRDDVNNQLSRLYYSQSVDEGSTWAPNVALTPQWNSQVGFPNQNKIGDYYHMISDNDGANLAYAATFNNEQDVYFMRICATTLVAPTSATSDRNNFCTDDPGNIMLTAVGGSGGTVQWYDDVCGGHGIGSGSPLTIASPAQTTTYFARREAASCTATSCVSVSVTVSAIPAAPTSPAATPPAICVGQSSTLSATAGTGETVDWFTDSCGGTAVPGGANPSVSPAVTTTYYARARNTTAGCLSATCSSVTVFLTDHTGDFDGGGVGESDLQPFVDTLLTKGPEQCIADMNNDGAADGLDIPLWIAAFLGL